MKTGHYYSASASDGYVDISSGRAVSQPVYAHGKKPNGGNKGKIALIISIAVVLTAAMGVTGFCLIKSNSNSEPEQPTMPTEFRFPGVKISGVDITGKNLKDAKAALEAKKTTFIKPVKIDVDVNGESTHLTQDDFSYTYNIDEVLETAQKEAESQTFTTATGSSDGKHEYEVTATVTQESISNKVTNFCESYNKDAVNAWVSKFHPYSDKRFEYEDAQKGYRIDSDNLKEQLIGFFGSGKNYAEIEAEGEELEAEVSKQFLKDNIVKLATYTTISYNSVDGTTNMQVALDACSGSIIDPGEIWSFNDCTGDSNKAENGYKPAGVISEGKFTTGVGGGICQASSTIYNAALRANMTIDTRYCHQFASAYVPTGLDATIDYPRLDLKLENTSGYQMFLECKVEGTTLYATFWGYKSPDYDVIKTRNKLEGGSGKTYKVRAWRVYYKDGKKVDEQELFESTYDYGGAVNFIDASGDTGAEGVDNDTSGDVSAENTAYSITDSGAAAQAAAADTAEVYSAEADQSDQAAEAPQTYYEEAEQYAAPQPDAGEALTAELY